jgi:hypothetical protein
MGNCCHKKKTPETKDSSTETKASSTETKASPEPTATKEPTELQTLQTLASEVELPVQH